MTTALAIVCRLALCLLLAPLLPGIINAYAAEAGSRPCEGAQAGSG